MPTESESHAPVATSPAPNKTLQLLRKRLRQLVRATLVISGCLALGAALLAIWWLTSLNGLPDIGDPFDVAAFRARRVPDEQNAFILLARADRMMTPWPDLPRGMIQSTQSVAWSQADPKLRAWVEANRPALELFQQAADQPAAGHSYDDPFLDVRPLSLSWLALVEGGRRQEKGESAAAWSCYRAILRMAVHVNRRGSFDQRLCVDYFLARGGLQKRLAAWAADSRTTTAQLESALGEMQKSAPDPEWNSFALKTEYLETMRDFERAIQPLDRQALEGEWTVRLADMQLSTDIMESIEAARRFWLREPDRSRRVLRLLWANHLAHAEARELPPSKPAVRPVLTASSPVSVDLYPVSPLAPAGARALSPELIARWLVSTRDARLRILGAYRRWSNNRMPPYRQYARAYREIVIMLATEIYRRERGTTPPSEGALVGTYLKALPDDGFADAADDTTPTIK